ncbi:MAG: hypothetical protein H6713_24405 [Myxococcales bacterium]|nr:hypothetical protein [Myxococcales bacterium]
MQTRTSPLALTLPVLALALACGDAGDDATTAGGSASAGTGEPSTGATTQPAATAGGTETGAGTDASTSTGGESTGDATTEALTSMGAKFDVGAQPDVGDVGCGGGGMGDVEFSYIYISNTAQGTLSKLNTQTMIEEGRYITRPDGVGSPSRTSVNLSGDVAVANRNGGITKVYARVDDCLDSNGTPGVQTSQSKDDILAWGEEECVAWHTPFDYTTQRPVQWTAGEFNNATCAWENQMLWTSGAKNNLLDVLLLDGDTGEVVNMVSIPEVPPLSFGAYGGAVDLEGDFWIMTYTSGFPLIEVELDTFNYTIRYAPQEVHGYGITVDHFGKIWIGADVGNTARYDPETDTWELVPGVTGLGIQEHPDGFMWMGTFPTTGIQAIDVETLELGPFIPLASPSQTKGVSIDFYGYVWLVDMTDSAWRIDPDTLQYDVYTGLNQPYTYSDMTGWGLTNVANPQG